METYSCQEILSVVTALPGEVQIELRHLDLREQGLKIKHSILCSQGHSNSDITTVPRNDTRSSNKCQQCRRANHVESKK